MGNRGAPWELEVCKGFRRLGVDADRNLVQAREGGVDVALDLPLAIECKDQKAPRIVAALEQATAAARQGEVPIAFIRIKQGRGTPAKKIAVLWYDDAMDEVLAPLLQLGWWR